MNASLPRKNIESLREFSPSFELTLRSFKEESRKPFIKAFFEPFFNFGPNFNPFVSFIEDVLEQVIPEEILHPLKNPHSSETLAASIHALNERLPLLTYSESPASSHHICVSLLCPANFTHGVGRYLTDVLCRWLKPGKFLGVSSTQSLNFQFQAFDKQNFFFHQVLLNVSDAQEAAQVKAQFSAVARLIRINILAVQHARQIVSSKKLTTGQKKTLIQEGISSLIDRPSKEHNNNVFDQMHHFLIQLSAEEMLPRIRDQFAAYLEQGPSSFDRDVFYEMQHLAMLFRDKFTGTRDLRHIIRVISFQYLFRKSLCRDMLSSPKERHLSLKLLKNVLHLPTGNKEVVGILVGINVLRENEFFEERHIASAIQHCLPSVQVVPESYIVDQRTHDNVRLFYLEIEKADGSPITLEELKTLRRFLPRELKGHFENVLHPVFMPRNEEEVLRHIVILSQQLKYLRDIPQVVISFEAQTEHELSFSVILLRLLIDGKPVRELFETSSTSLKLLELEVKQVGHLRKKYIKEANIFRINIDKKPFLRKDYSLDLFKARQAVSLELSQILGEIRDFNGGILSKQHEVFHKLKDLISEAGHSNDFLLENFFYSLAPTIMQSILSPSLLKTLFLMLLDNLENHSPTTPNRASFHEEPDSVLAMLTISDPALKKSLLSAISLLKIPSSFLTTTSVDAYETSNLGFIYRCEDPEQRAAFIHTIQHSL